jgi:hypothetical protein
MSTQSGKVDLIDWEAATFSHRGFWRFRDEIKEPGIRRKAVHDLQVLFGSLARPLEKHGVGLLHHLTPRAQFSYFNELVLAPYIEERLRLIEEETMANFDEKEAAMLHVGEIEHETTYYIQSNGLQNSLTRSRQT